MLPHSLQPFKKALNLPSHVLKISIIHLIATQKATLEGEFSEHVKCKDILVKKEVKKEFIPLDSSGSYLGILLLVTSFPGIVTIEL